MRQSFGYTSGFGDGANFNPHDGLGFPIMLQVRAGVATVTPLEAKLISTDVIKAFGGMLTGFAQRSPLALDMSKVEFISSPTFMGMLAANAIREIFGGQRLAIFGISPEIREGFDKVNLGALFHLCTTVDEALTYARLRLPRSYASATAQVRFSKELGEALDTADRERAFDMAIGVLRSASAVGYLLAFHNQSIQELSFEISGYPPSVERFVGECNSRGGMIEARIRPRGDLN